MDDRQRKPLISTEDEKEKTSGGCLSNLLGIAGFIFLIIIIFHSCSGDSKAEASSEYAKSQIKQTETSVTMDTPFSSAYEVALQTEAEYEKDILRYT